MKNGLFNFNHNWTSTVLPIVEQNGGIKIGGTEGDPVEYYTKMENLPEQWLLSGLWKMMLYPKNI